MIIYAGCIYAVKFNDKKTIRHKNYNPVQKQDKLILQCISMLTCSWSCQIHL